MNQRIEICLESTLNNFTYKLCVPVGPSFDDALNMVDQFKAEIQRMKDIAEQQEAAKRTAANS